MLSHCSHMYDCESYSSKRGPFPDFIFPDLFLGDNGAVGSVEADGSSVSAVSSSLLSCRSSFKRLRFAGLAVDPCLMHVLCKYCIISRRVGSFLNDESLPSTLTIPQISSDCWLGLLRSCSEFPWRTVLHQQVQCRGKNSCSSRFHLGVPPSRLPGRGWLAFLSCQLCCQFAPSS